MSAPDHSLLERIKTLEAENTSLRNALQHGDKANTEYERLFGKYNDLYKAYRELQDKNAKYHSYVDRATDKYRAAKETVKQWQKFYDHQQRKADRLLESSAHVNRASSPVPDDGDLERTPRPVSARSPHRQSRAEEATEVKAEPRSADSDAQEQVDLPNQAHHDPSQSRSSPSNEALEDRARRITSSQTTEGVSDPANPYDIRPSSDDEPDFVSARPVKRRRGNSPRATRASTQIKQERTSPSQPHEINSEDFSSPTLKQRQPLRRQTSNLDALVGVVDSPTRRRERRAASAGAMQPTRMPAMPTMTSLSEGDILDPVHHMENGDLKVSAVTTDHTVRTRDFAWEPEGSNQSERALQPLSANIAQSNRRADAGNMKRKRRDESPRRRAAKAAIVSEDGDMDSSQVQSEEHKRSSTNAVSRRLDSLLDEPTPGRNQVIRRALPEKLPRLPLKQPAAPAGSILKPVKRSPVKQPVAETRPTFKMPNVPSLKQAVAASTNSRKRPHPEPAPPPPRPEDEPLRSRPVIRLEIDDFKVNPKYKGTDFAFADTLRGRNQRRCLPGCTKPECCGDIFRKAVAMGVKGKKTDNEALEAYLGPAFASHMASRTPAEREDVLLKARTYAMASEYGKHRQAFKRRASPPGFWRIDMPSTQEEEQDRAQALEMVRQEVYERWREAMNPNGRWKFRDE